MVLRALPSQCWRVARRAGSYCELGLRSAARVDGAGRSGGGSNELECSLPAHLTKTLRAPSALRPVGRVVTGDWAGGSTWRGCLRAAACVRRPRRHRLLVVRTRSGTDCGRPGSRRWCGALARLEISTQTPPPVSGTPCNWFSCSGCSCFALMALPTKGCGPRRPRRLGARRPVRPPAAGCEKRMMQSHMQPQCSPFFVT